jgi:transcriptional regulator with XRE-family HTH domain
MKTNTIGERLREERERLGMSQAAFGALGGVLKLAQLNYEKGARLPPYHYFDKLREQKEVDVGYILSGERAGDARHYREAEARVNTLIAIELGLEPGAFGEAVEIAVHQLRERSALVAPPDEMYLADNLDPALLQVENAVGTIVGRSPNVFDYAVLEELFSYLENALSGHSPAISPEKKAQIFAMLYRTSKAGGRVDPQVVQDAIRLAS